MISTLGNTALWLTLFFSLFQFLISSKKENQKIIKFNRLAVLGLLISISISFFSLIYSHIISDFSLVNVYQNSHSTKPFVYKISGVWGNHEGSMLLWVFVLAIFNYFIFKIYDSKNFSFISKTLETQAIVIFGFTLFTILTSNPFEKMKTSVLDGLGFNPILQDPALVIHPPLLYIGYVGFSAAFSMSIAALKMENNNNFPWYIYMKPFVLVAWASLTIGIAFGSLWAYYELGWGGWWFWDPVENASFMPWLLGTALIHSLIIFEKKKILGSWVLLLSILIFLLSVIGTFLVRSGILTSVHTFALDPSRGIFILMFAVILGCYSLTLFATRTNKNINDSFISIFSREGAILINNILMVVVCASVLLGTIYPLIIEALSNNKISVGEPYFNSTVVPIMIPALLVMGVGPILSWGRNDKFITLTKITPNILVTIILTCLFFLLYNSYTLTGITGVALSMWIISNNSIDLFKSRTNRKRSMIVSHLGVGLLILGITGSSVWQEEKIILMKIDSETKIKEYNIVFKDLNEVKEKNYLAIQGIFEVYNNNNKFITHLKPEKRFYPITKIFTTEAYIHTNLFRDLYIVLGDGNKNNGWVIKIYYNPLVVWIWIGALVIFIGGLMSIVKSFKLIKN